ncbi:MAG: cell division protein FtsA [Candidatus Fischerbacteria bacterium RBG_13_37_8]|uniref:Cell division protein FtsA n=1 Tax=Candidatus Fischerbacteria bacterium RBG_13_37_8 TaxID=1817863 RepID=A0A1F5VGI6_9BACT|nr:MAG: cell division protein FtsA [Candidatus Fischerbacteria bacterium RBG_13_37_8]
MMSRKEHYIVGLDIGTSKVCALIGELREDGILSVIGYGTVESKGVSRGVVVAMEPVIECIKKAVGDAELMSGVSIEKVFVGISGSHIIGFNSRGVITVSSQGRKVTRDDINRVLEASKNISIPQDKYLLHVIPQEFIVDDHPSIIDPMSMLCSKLEVNAHIVTCSNIALRNLVECVNRAGIPKVVPVLEQLAGSIGVLREDEKKLGVALIDIGGGTSSLAVFDNGSLWHTFVLPMGGNNFTNDISIGVRTSLEEAERIKKKYASASPTFVSEDETIEIQTVGGATRKVLSKQIINEIVKPRAEEIFVKIKDELRRVDLYQYLTAGIVITGGGALLEGMADMAQAIFDLNVRIGKPYGAEGLNDVIDNPVFASSVGLVKHGSESLKLGEKYDLDKSWLKRVVNKIIMIFE